MKKKENWCSTVTEWIALNLDYMYMQVLATTVGNLADISPAIPISMFAASALISAVLSLTLPETQVQ